MMTPFFRQERSAQQALTKSSGARWAYAPLDKRDIIWKLPS
ncbi:MAG TPA: hypothetical protein VGQ41_08260 [Pyrinomonadaceae bacterium]|nr:hypothetical protein [Pyrinomonadaceae bacterium]